MLRIKKASAGSGKTFTLARQYITLLLGHRDRKSGRLVLFTQKDYGFLKPKPHGRILAITFTKKATQEMTDRIIKELAILANPGEKDEKGEPIISDHLDHLCEVYSATPEQIAEAAQRALADMLFNFSSFNVSTIDSFFQNVLRIFTRELDLPEVFNLEIDENYPVAVATGEMLSSINLPVRPEEKEAAHRQRMLKSWMQAYMDALLEEGENANLLARSSRVSRQLVATLSALRSETYKANRTSIQEYLADPDRIERFTKGLHESLVKWRNKLTAVSQAIFKVPEAQYIPKSLLKYTLTPWAAGNFSYDPCMDDHGKERKTLTSAIADRELRYNKTPLKGRPWPEDVDSLLLQLLTSGRDYFDTARFYQILRRQIYILGLFSHSERHIEEYCRNNEAFLLGDTNLLLRKVITDVEAPFVYERIGTTINNFLIDEFQDTSEMQWVNLAPLVRESMGRRQDNLIIGDEKQCIYRFRNSNPELLGSEVQTSMAQTFGADAVEVSGADIKDNTNWRSMRNVVLFNNTLFKRLAILADRGVSRPLAEATYSALVQQVAPKHLKPGSYPGYVKVLMGPTGSEVTDEDPKANSPVPDESNQPAAAPVKPWSSDDQLCLLTSEISRQLAAGYHPKDIAILVRRHSEGELIIHHLLEVMKDSNKWPHGQVAIMSDDALEISSSPSVQLIIGILRLCTTPQYIIDDTKSKDEATKEENRILNPAYLRNRLIHRYELCVFDRTPLLDENNNPVLDDNGEPRTRLLTAEEALTKAVRATTPHPGSPDLDEKQRQLDTVVMEAAEMDCPSLFAIVERIIHDCLPQESLSRENSFLSAFQDLVLDFEEKGDADIDSFLDWWDSKGKRQTLPPPEGMDALKIMTIHQAKGLEMPCVHVPFCEPDIYNLKGLDWYELNRNGFPGIDPTDVPPFIPLKGSPSLQRVHMLREQYESIKQTQIIDCLNVIYVAFTRAVDELIVYSNPAKRGDHFGKLLLEALRSENLAVDPDTPESPWLIPLAPEMHLDPTSRITTFELGIQGPPSSEPSAAQTPAAAQSPTVAKISEREAVSAPALPGNSQPSQPSDSFEAEIDYEALLESYPSHRPAEMIVTDDIAQQTIFDRNNERHRGNFLHDALAHVRTPDDLPIALERAAYRRALEPEYWRPLLLQLQTALADPRVRPWFEGYERIMTERPLTARSSLRRPDRIIFHPDGTISVVDYKFGSPTEKYRDTYREQVRDYMSLLTSCGYTSIRGYLFYPLSGVILPVE